MSQWNQMKSIPKSGKVLLGVWEGEWRKPRKEFRVFEARCYAVGQSWGRNYRNEEGEAYEVVGWMPMPAPPLPMAR